MALPTASHILAPERLPALPKSWSELSWQQLTDCWLCKMRYGGNPDVARAAALLALCGLKPVDMTDRSDGTTASRYDEKTGEAVYWLSPTDNGQWSMVNGQLPVYMVTPRELSQMAQQSLPWFDYPYGDHGKEAVKDDSGKVIEEAVGPVRGYVNPGWRDAMMLPEETVTIDGLCFALPQVACNSLTWQQYRSLQALAPGLFDEGASEEDIISRQAEFVAHMLVPASEGQQSGDRFAPKHTFQYDADRAEQTISYWRRLLTIGHSAAAKKGKRSNNGQWSMVNGQSNNVQWPMVNVQCLFHILFQTYQTAMKYYEQVFPLLFNGGGKQDPLQDALTGETRTLNAVMKYQGYTKPEDVYAENLPVILSTLNTMAEEAKQIEQMNARIKKKH